VRKRLYLATASAVRVKIMVVVSNLGWGRVVYVSVSQPPGRGPVPSPGINYTGPREFVILVF
jgi:hypothetical protein